jgi:hypothetical protein
MAAKEKQVKMVCEKHKDKCLIIGDKGEKTCWDCTDEMATKAMHNIAESAANSRQVGGDHYINEIQHWDYAAFQNLDYFQGQITKYVTRWKKKGGVKDLEKALHFLQKYIEINQRPK